MLTKIAVAVMHVDFEVFPLLKCAIMARLRIYTVHINPSLVHPYESAEFVQEGFSFRAFVFSTLWALYHRLWGMAALLFAYNLSVIYLFNSRMISHSGLLIVDIGFHLVIGFEATEWLRARLKKEGYITADITTGDSPLRAEQRFFDRHFASEAPPPVLLSR